LNQDGKPIHLSDFRGKALLLTFIYTRCPMPTFCPRISSLFASVNRELAKNPKDYDRTRLLSISIDPKYDTPSVLHKYGLACLGNDPQGFVHWQFAVPTPENLRKLAEAFSLLYEEEDNQISHTMSTVLVGPDGRVAKEWIMKRLDGRRGSVGHPSGGKCRTVGPGSDLSCSYFFVDWHPQRLVVLGTTWITAPHSHRRRRAAPSCTRRIAARAMRRTTFRLLNNPQN
jgi:peroxiredoxin